MKSSNKSLNADAQGAWATLVALTLAVQLLSKFDLSPAVLSALVLGLSGTKFFIVGFRYMHLAEAHQFWRYSLTVYLCLFYTLTFALVLK